MTADFLPPDPPVVLGQTIALDLSGNWWTRFWRCRRGYKNCADDFAKLIHAETRPIVDSLITENAQAFEAALNLTLEEFLATNRRIIEDMAKYGTSTICSIRVAAPNPATALGPWRASSATTTADASGMIMLVPAAGRPTRSTCRHEETNSAAPGTS